MVMIFSWDPSSKIIFLHVVLGGGGGGGGVCVFQILSEFSRHPIQTRCEETTLQRNDFVAK